MTRSSIWDIERARHAEPPLRITPRGVCTHCRRFDYCPLQLPLKCYWCGQGEFTERGFWGFGWCAACDGEDPFCMTCHGKRIVATPLGVVK